MWFSFGIISLSLFTIYFTYKKINASWKGESIQLGQKSCKFKKTRPIIGSADALIGINSAKGIDYIFKREGWFDRVFKSLGLVNEHQVGNPKFDDLVFIVSDDVSLHQQLSKNSVIVSTVLDIFSCVDNSTFSVKQIRHNSGCLWVKLGAHIKFTEEDIKELTPKFAPLLETLSEEMQKISGHSKPLWKRPQSFISAALLGISTALAVTGYIQFKRLSLSLPDLPHVIDANLMLNHAIMLGGAFVLLLVVLTVYLLGRSPRTHLVLLEVILLGGFGAFMTSFSELNHFNHTYDETSVQIFEARVLDKKRLVPEKVQAITSTLMIGLVLIRVYKSESPITFT